MSKVLLSLHEQFLCQRPDFPRSGGGGGTTSRSDLLHEEIVEWEARRGSGGGKERDMDSTTVLHSGRRRIALGASVGQTSCAGSFADDHGVVGVTDSGRRRACPHLLREGRPIIELFLCCFNLCCAWIMHDEDSKRLQVRGDGAPSTPRHPRPLFRVLHGRTYDDGTTEYLFLRAFANRVEREAKMVNRGKEGLESRRRTKPSID